MKKLIAFFVVFSLFFVNSKAQTGSQKTTLQSYGKVIPTLADSIFGSHIGSNKNFLITDLLNLEGPRTATYSGKTMSGSNNNFSNIPESAITNLLPDLTNLTNAIATKQAALNFTPENSANKGIPNGYAPLNSSQKIPITYLGSGTPDGTKFLGDDGIFRTPTGTGNGGSAVAFKPYVDVPYSSTINLDFDATTSKNITAWNGNITFTASNNTSGKYCVVYLNKTTASDVTITFSATSLTTSPKLDSYTGFCTPVTSSSPRYFTVKAPVNTQLLLTFDMLPTGPYITAKNIQDSDYPVVQRANILNLKNFPAFADPGATTAETVVNSFKVTANTLSDSSNLVIDYIYRRRSGAGVIQVKIRACPANNTTLSNCPIIEDFGQSNNFGDFRRTALLTNVSQSSNIVQPGYLDGANTPESTTTNIDWSQDVYLKFTVQKQQSSTQVGGFVAVRINGEGL